MHIGHYPLSFKGEGSRMYWNTSAAHPINNKTLHTTTRFTHTSIGLREHCPPPEVAPTLTPTSTIQYINPPAGETASYSKHNCKAKTSTVKSTPINRSTMSLFPFGLAHGPQRLLDQEFGIALTPDDLLSAVVSPMLPREYYRPWRQLAAAARDVGSTITSNKDKFQINLDVQHFAPEEITVKTADGYVIIEGKHEEKKDEHGFISRQFKRRYALPDNCDPATVESKLSSDGVLSVIAPKTAPDSKNERYVPIAQTGPIRKEIKDGTNQQMSQTDANGTEK